MVSSDLMASIVKLPLAPVTRVKLEVGVELLM